MSFFGKDIETLDNLFVHTLQDIYYAEKQILKALPEMEQKASNAQLKTAFKSHFEETKSHVKRLEQVFKMNGQEPKGVDCPAIDGIIEEANDVASDVDDKQVLDAALAAAAQAGRALRDVPLRNLGRLGEAARAQRLRERARTDVEGRAGRRSEADQDRGNAAQPAGRGLNRSYRRQEGPPSGAAFRLC